VTAYEEVKAVVEKLLQTPKTEKTRTVQIYYRDIAKLLEYKYSEAAILKNLKKICREIGGEYVKGTCIVITT
jgi:hypothetical protein